MTPPLYTVQCGYAAYYAITLSVEDAATVDDACARAIEDANGLDGWRSIDHCGPTFVDAIAAGDVDSPWSPQTYASILPVRAKYREGGVAAAAARECIAFVERVSAYVQTFNPKSNRRRARHVPDDRLDLLNALIGEAKAIRDRNNLPSASAEA